MPFRVQIGYVVIRDIAFQEELEDGKYIFKAPSSQNLADFENATRAFTTALAGPVSYCLNSHFFALSWIQHASQADWSFCKKAIPDIGSFSEKVPSFICTAIFFDIL